MSQYEENWRSSIMPLPMAISLQRVLASYYVETELLEWDADCAYLEAYDLLPKQHSLCNRAESRILDY